MHAQAFDLASRPCLFRGSERPPTQAIPGRLFAARAKAYRATPSVTLRQPGRLGCARHSPRSRALLAGAKIKKPLHADSASLYRRSPFALLRVGLDGRRFFDFRSGAVAPARERATGRHYARWGSLHGLLAVARTLRGTGPIRLGGCGPVSRSLAVRSGHGTGPSNGRLGTLMLLARWGGPSCQKPAPGRRFPGPSGRDG